MPGCTRPGGPVKSPSPPFILFYHPGRQDYWLAANESDNKEAEGNDYMEVGVQGYLLVPKGK